jgi:hypothetical protein
VRLENLVWSGGDGVAGSAAAVTVIPGTKPVIIPGN